MRSYLRNLKWAHNEFYAMHYQNISMNSNPENDLNTEKIVDAIVQDQNETVSTEENQNITVPPGTVPLIPRNDKLALPENIPYEDYVYHFLLELREKYKVSGVACEFVAQEMKKRHLRWVPTVNGGVYPNGGTPATRRSTNDIPHYNDEAFLSSSFTWGLYSCHSGHSSVAF